MLPAKHRLRHEVDILKVLRHGQRQDHQAATIYTSKSDQTLSRAACIVGKKVSPSAVVRHRYQRWLRELAAEMMKTSQKPVDVVLVAKPAILQSKSLADLKQAIL